MNAIKSFLAAERVSGKGQTPNRAVKALGATSLSVTMDNVLKISGQNLVKEEQLQNFTVANRHRSHRGDTVSKMFARRALVY